MESDSTHSPSLYDLWAWFEKNKQKVVLGAVAALVIGLIVYFIIWRQTEARQEAGRALSAVAAAQMTNPGANTDSPEAFLKVAEEYSGTEAGAQALLRAGAAYFVQGKYAEAQTQFARFQQQYRQNPFIGQALLGVAASLEAQGKTAEAIESYRMLVERHPGESVVPQAKFALARLYEAQNKPELARNLYEEITRGDPYGSIGSEAGMHLEDLKAKYPELAAPRTNVTSAVRTPAAVTNVMQGTNPPAVK